MASTWSQNLKIELITTGEQTGDWGETTNDNFANVLEQAIVGKGNPDFSTDADLTISLSDSTAEQVARAYFLEVTSSVIGGLTTTRNLVVPTIEKPYIVKNSTSGSQSIIVKTAAGTGITVANGKTTMVYVDGTNVVQAIDYIPSLTLGTALPIASGGTGATSASAARTSLGLGTISTQAFDNVSITGGAITGVTISSLGSDLAVTDGGTGASDATSARSNLSAAKSGANSDITSLSGLTTPLSAAQGGTGATSNAAAPFALKGANSDITSLSGLTTALSIGQGGTGAATATAAITALLPSQTGNSGKVLQTNGTVAAWETVSSGSGISITDDSSTNAVRYPLFTNAITGSITTEFVSSAKLNYNPSTGVFTATSFSGAGTGLTGTASSLTAGTATTTTNVAVASDTSTTTCYPLFSTASTSSSTGAKTNSSRLSFNSSTGALSATSFSGAGTGLTGTAAGLTVGAATTAAGLSSTLAISSGGTGSTSLAGAGIVTTSGAQTISGTKTFTSYTALGAASPSTTWNLYVKSQAAQPAVAIECAGSTSQGLSLFGNSAVTGQIFYWGSATVPGSAVGTIGLSSTATTYNTSSDYRLKDNPTPMTGSWAKVKALKPVTYTWKVNGEQGEGFIAHELQEVVPLAVTGEKDAIDTNGNPKYQGVDYSKVVPVLAAALQEALARIEALEAK